LTLFAADERRLGRLTGRRDMVKLFDRLNLHFSLSSQLADAAVAGNNIEPGDKGRFPLRIESRQGLVHVEEHILSDVFGQMRIPHETMDEAEEIPVVFPDKDGKCVHVAVLNPSDYRVVVHPVSISVFTLSYEGAGKRFPDFFHRR
jgi:hypothetical protein